MTYDKFIEKCTPCGGNWVAMIMSGIKEVAPEIFEEMSDRSYGFDEVCFIANHLCYDRPHFPFNFNYRGYVIEHTVDGKFIYRDMTEEELHTPWELLERKYNGIEKDENGIWKRVCEGE